jgi:integrase/recombinase XerC
LSRPVISPFPGDAAGLPRPARPHGLRHAAITRANQKTNGNARMTQEFARHSDPKTTDRYIKADKDNFGAVGDLLARDDGE